MYEKNLQLKQRPFTTALCVQHWCDVGNAGSVIQQTCSVVQRGMGISVIVGAAGTGKTMTLEMIARHCSDQNPEIVQITCSRLDTRRDVLQRMLFECNVSSRDMPDSDLRLLLIQHFRSVCGQHGRDVLLLIDEAHNLPTDLLDELRIIAESAARNQGRCHLILAGTSRLEEHLNHTDLDTFNQRIVCRCYLKPMTREETAAYVRQHLLRSGGGQREYFDETALKEIATTTGGIPRLVNQLCDQCLVSLVASNGKMVAAEMVRNAWCDIQNLPRQSVVAAVQPTGGNSSGPVMEMDSVEFGGLDDEPGNTSDDVAGPGKTAVPTDDPQVAQLNFGGPTARNTVPAGSRSNPFAEPFASEQPVGKKSVPKKAAAATSAMSGEQTIGAASENGSSDLVSTIYGNQGSNPVEPPIHLELRGDLPVFEHQDTTLDAPDGHDLCPHQETVDATAEGQSTVPCANSDLIETRTFDEDLARELPTIPIKARASKANKSRTPDDDRDILLTKEETCFDPSPLPEAAAGETQDDSRPGGLRGPHAARAVRMDYRQLFAQLRDEPN